MTPVGTCNPGSLSGGSRRIVTAALCMLLGTICAPAETALAGRLNGVPADTASEAVVAIPPYPYAPNETIVVDQALIDQMAAEYCAETPGATGEDFMFGYLPLATFDAMCGASPSEVSRFLGNLYVSGYFGGVWLRDTLDDGARVSLLKTSSGWGPRDFVMSPHSGDRMSEDVLFRILTRAVASQVQLAEQGGALVVLGENRKKLPGVLSIFGYNLGYTLFMLSSPPEGAAPMDDALVCGDYVLDCDSPAVDLALLDRFRPALGPLQHPYNMRWARMDELVQEYAAGSVEMGQEVWEDIVASSPVSPEAYPLLMDLSIGFLLVSDAAALGGITAWATQDVVSGRCALLAQAGLTVWSVSYFMGLVSSAPEGTTVSLNCSGTPGP